MDEKSEVAERGWFHVSSVLAIKSLRTRTSEKARE